MQRSLDLPRTALDLGFRRQRFGEYHIRACIQVGVGAAYEIIDAAAGDAACITACNQKEVGVGIAPDVICCAYLTDHFTKRYDLLARDVAAALRRNLVFDVNGSDTRCHEFFHRTHHVDGVAKAGIGIGDHRYVDCCCDIARHHDHFSHRGKANIGTSEQRHGHAVTGDTATRESSLLDDACCEC